LPFELSQAKNIARNAAYDGLEDEKVGTVAANQQDSQQDESPMEGM